MAAPRPHPSLTPPHPTHAAAPRRPAPSADTGSAPRLRPRHARVVAARSPRLQPATPASPYSKLPFIQRPCVSPHRPRHAPKTRPSATQRPTALATPGALPQQALWPLHDPTPRSRPSASHAAAPPALTPVLRPPHCCRPHLPLAKLAYHTHVPPAPPSRSPIIQSPLSSQSASEDDLPPSCAPRPLQTCALHKPPACSTPQPCPQRCLQPLLCQPQTPLHRTRHTSARSLSTGPAQ